MTNLSKALEVLARQPLPETVERYDAAAHIFNWARNDARLCGLMRTVRTPGNFLHEREQAREALELAVKAMNAGAHAGDISRQLVEASDLLRASIMFLAWDGES